MSKFEVNDKGKLEDEPDAFVAMYGAELWMEEQPIISEDNLLENLKKYCGKIEIISKQETSITFGFLEYIMEYKNASLPVAITISLCDEELQNEKLKRSLDQSWNYDNKKELIAKCKYNVLVTDTMAVGLDYAKRIELFQKALYAIVELTQCEGINYYISEQVISREDYLKNNPLDDDYDPLFGILNVRLFNIEGNEKEYLMDTLGLSAIGLYDLQCHFKNLDPNEIANLLYSYGYYIFDKGDAVADIKIIQGISENDEWECQHEISIAEPRRVVLDINPGEEFSTENREQII